MLEGADPGLRQTITLRESMKIIPRGGRAVIAVCARACLCRALLRAYVPGAYTIVGATRNADASEDSRATRIHLLLRESLRDPRSTTVSRRRTVTVTVLLDLIELRASDASRAINLVDLTHVPRALTLKS